MEKLLNIVEEDSSSGEIKKDRLRFFSSKVKVWDYAEITQNECQNLSIEDRSSLLKLYYNDMCVKVCLNLIEKRFDFVQFLLDFFLILSDLFLILFWIFFSENPVESNAMSVLKKANLLTLTNRSVIRTGISDPKLLTMFVISSLT